MKQVNLQAAHCTHLLKPHATLMPRRFFSSTGGRLLHTESRWKCDAEVNRVRWGHKELDTPSESIVLKWAARLRPLFQEMPSRGLLGFAFWCGIQQRMQRAQSLCQSFPLEPIFRGQTASLATLVAELPSFGASRMWDFTSPNQVIFELVYISGPH